MVVSPPPRTASVLSSAVPDAPRTRRGTRAHELGIWTVLAATALYCAVLGGVSILRYLTFHYSGDTADYAQMLWNTVHGRLLQKTYLYGAGAGLRGGHAEPLLLLLALPYALLQDPRTMLALQTLALASGGPLTYALARLHGHTQRVAAILALFYLAFPLVHYANIWDFHPDPFAVPLLFAALLAFDTGRWRLLALSIGLILLTKEQMVLFVVGLGAYWWLARGNRRVGLACIAAALGYGLVVLLPWFAATSSQFTHDYGSYFGDLQGATAAHGTGLAGKAQAILTLLGERFRFQNEFLALLPTGFLFLFDASAMVTFLPLAGLFVSNEFTNDFWFHHYVTCVPIFLYGTIRVLAGRRLRPRAGFVGIVLTCWAALLGYSYSYSSLNMMYWIHQPSMYLPDDRSRAAAAFIRAVPDGAGLDSDSALGAHLTARIYLYQIQVASQPSLVPYTLLDLHQDMQNPPDWMVLNDRLTLAYIRRHAGFRLVQADHRYGFYLFANCARFPAAHGCSELRSITVGKEARLRGGNPGLQAVGVDHVRGGRRGLQPAGLPTQGGRVD